MKYLSINVAIGLSGILSFASIFPLLKLKLNAGNDKKIKKYTSINQHLIDLPKALTNIRGGLALMFLGGMVGGITFSAKEIISSLASTYGVDIRLIGIIAATAMAGRIVGTDIEKLLKIGHKTLLFLLVISTIIAQMLFYRLKYSLASESPQTYVASVLSSLTLVGKFFSSGIIFTLSLFTGFNAFHPSFIAIAFIISIFGGYPVFILNGNNVDNRS